MRVRGRTKTAPRAGELLPDDRMTEDPPSPLRPCSAFSQASFRWASRRFDEDPDMRIQASRVSPSDPPKASRRDFLVGSTAAGVTMVAGAGCKPSANFAAQVRADLFSAVERGDRGRVQQLLRDHTHLATSRDTKGRSLLTWALLKNRPELVDVLRAEGCQPDLTESAALADWKRFDALADRAPGWINRRHPLHGGPMGAAAAFGRGRDLWRVYGVGAVPNPNHPDIFSPLRSALAREALEAAEVAASALLANGADPNRVEPDGRSALHAAAARGSAAIVEMLIRKGAVLNARDPQKRRPLDLAEEAGHAGVVALLQNPQTIARDFTSLRRRFDVHGKRCPAPGLPDMSARVQNRFVQLGHARFDALKSELAREPRWVHALATNTEMAVDAAGHMGRADIVRYLLDRGASYALASALVLGELSEIRRLLDAEPRRIHERGPHDIPPLWYPALAGGNLEVAELLIERGAEVEAQHILGTTALHVAAQHGQKDMVALSLDEGADVHRMGRQTRALGETPLDIATRQGHSEVAELLRHRGARS